MTTAIIITPILKIIERKRRIIILIIQNPQTLIKIIKETYQSTKTLIHVMSNSRIN